MMRPLTTDYTNAMLGAPADWDPTVHGECIGLPVHRDHANNRWLSWYQPTEQDIANLLAGVPIRLSVYGAGHPPRLH
ncbi:hypothetical protein [Cupriavidus oxalaticus]|uniref:Uncharacterized protein n=1 Tax=Cupriavidus oxalaticus TaxID=96344 RepID=A0A5P3VP19_9BURK|nr:hypothetical protein [Cupriavidus oxalaticus]QEZ47193.1 hypothetical protein D2917_23880 [Cupriavidus oxalaticus]